MINFGLKTGVMVFLSLLDKYSKNLPNQYVILIEEKKAFYDAVRARMAKPKENL
jgi:hypothetical protein